MTGKNVCGGCKKAAVSDGAPWGLAVTICKTVGAEIADHTCGKPGTCACACGGA